MLGSRSDSVIRPSVLLAFGILVAGLTGYAFGSEGSAVAANVSAPPVAKPVTRAPSPERHEPSVPVTLPVTTIQRGPHPLDGISQSELQRLAVRAPERLGSASIGKPNRGRLLNGVQLEPSPGIRVVDGTSSYGTTETIRSIHAAVAEVLRQFPGSSELPIGDISRKGGGHLRPHRSHQTGLDVDIGYYYVDAAGWYTNATADNLDRPRTWALLKAFIARGNVEYVFMDRSIQNLLEEYAESIGESRELLDGLFQSPKRKDTIVRHRQRHLSHFHIRLHDPVSEETGRRVSAHARRSKS